MYSHLSLERADGIKQKPIRTMDQAIHSLDREGPPPFSTTQAQSSPAKVIKNVESLPQVCKHTQQIVVEKVTRELAKHLQ